MRQRPVYFYVGRHSHPFFDEQRAVAADGFPYRTDAQGEAAAGPRAIALGRGPAAALRSGLELGAIRTLSQAGYVRRVRVQAPAGCELIHSAQYLLREPALPYVVDFECVEAFSLYQRVALRRPWARARLLAALRDERCRFLLPWSQAARRGLKSALGESNAAVLEAKTETVLPAVMPRASRARGRGQGPLRVLFIGTAFFAKGGVEAIRAVRRLRDSHDVRLDLVSNVPAWWRAEIEPLDGVTAHDWPVGSERLAQLFADAHVLVFPSHMDTLGFVMLEAMAHGMPVVATSHFSVPELVEHGGSGLLVEGENLLYSDDGLCRYDRTLPPPRSFTDALRNPSEEYVQRLAGALATLAEDDREYERLAGGALARVTEGPLSPPRRREALTRVYRRACES